MHVSAFRLRKFLASLIAFASAILTRDLALRAHMSRQSHIIQLEKEAGADATKKAYCDKETAEATSSKNDKAADVEKLSVRIDRMAARSASLKDVEVPACADVIGCWFESS